MQPFERDNTKASGSSTASDTAKSISSWAWSTTRADYREYSMWIWYKGGLWKQGIRNQESFMRGNWITLAIFNLSGNIPVIRDWFITRVRGFSRAGDINFNNLVDMPSCPDEFFVRKYDKVLATWFSSTREKLKEFKKILTRYLWWVSWETLDTLLMRLGPILIKKALNLLTISVVSFILLPLDIIDFTPWWLCFVLHNMSLMVLHVIFILDRLYSNSRL